MKKFIKISAKIGLILLIFISIFILSRSVLVSPDDYNYTYVQGNGDREKIDSIAHILKTSNYIYNNWTGRVIPHVMIGIFRNLPPIAYEIANALVFVIFIIFVSKVLNKKSTFLSILSVFGYLVFSMMFGEKFGWMSGSFNYLWTSTLLAIFVYFSYNFFINSKDINIYKAICLSLFGFLTAFCHENVAFVGGAFLVSLFLFNVKEFLKFDNKKKIALIIIFIMFCLGAIATIFAPGNLVRKDTEAKTFSWMFLQNYSDNKWILLTVLISMILAFVSENFDLLKKEKFQGLKKADYSLLKFETLNFILPALFATIPMAIIVSFPPRAFLAYEVMFMIVLSRNVTVIAEHLEKHDVIIAVLSIVFSLIIFGKYSPSTLAQINYIIPYKKHITAQYEQAVKNGEKDVLISSFAYMHWIHKDDNINLAYLFPEINYKMPVNALIAQYYGFDKVTAIGDEDYLIELEVDTEGLNTYCVNEVGTGRNIYTFQFDNFIRYTVPKDTFGNWLLDCSENNLENKLIDYKVRFIGGEIPKEEIDLNKILEVP